MSGDFVTFVVRIDNQEQAANVLRPLMDAFADKAPLEGLSVTNVTFGDEMDRAERLARQLDDIQRSSKKAPLKEILQ